MAASKEHSNIKSTYGNLSADTKNLLKNLTISQLIWVVSNFFMQNNIPEFELHPITYRLPQIKTSKLRSVVGTVVVGATEKTLTFDKINT